MTDAPTENAHGKLRDGLDSARDKASSALEGARSRATGAVEASRDRARNAAQRTAETVETNPIGVIVGGLALGALVAAVIPRGKREKELLAPIGKRVGATAASAIAAAKSAGKSELDSLGINKDAARSQAKSLLDGLVKAASSAGNAATKAGKEGMGSH
ncbi:MAG: hypothetical protein P0Y64_14660 [Candidatus Sphingomonas colombiensis]|nr:hypothetical protein [Sphingomonas sp.]WEK42610.1 MAG: hypothetical protein P0Y64_14660 [Sphingomonas sp.]